jgi:hypothetical protein
MKGFVGVTDNEWCRNGIRRRAYGARREEAQS